MSPKRFEEPIPRRDFLGLAAFGSFFLSVGTALVGILRLPKPGVLPESASRFKVGFPDEFPPDTVHVAVVDPGVGTARRALGFRVRGAYFLAPDNGLIGYVLSGGQARKATHLSRLKYFRRPVSSTFHGRDIFAPVAAELAAGRLSLTAIGKPVTEWTPGWLDEPEVTADKITGTIITIDAFGNLISNIDASLIKEFREPVAHIGGHQIQTLSTYGRTKPGNFLALVNSFGVIEVARSEGSAAEGLGAERGAPLVITDGYTT